MNRRQLFKGFGALAVSFVGAPLLALLPKPKSKVPDWYTSTEIQAYPMGYWPVKILTEDEMRELYLRPAIHAALADGRTR